MDRETVSPSLTLVDTRDAVVEPELGVYCWRVERLLDAGYSPFVAAELADDERVDLHLACALLARGCDEETAYHILA